MFRAIIICVLMLVPIQAFAQSCPDFFRFVDFGLEANDGKIYRGGMILRAEGFEGQSLLLSEQTKCRDITDLAEDGHGNPIPVVTSINYDPAETGLDLTELNVSLLADTEAAVANNGTNHQTLLKSSDAASTRGANFLCVRERGMLDLSCQVVSPYSGNIPLFVYCDPTQCKISALAINDRVQVRAVWEIEENSLSDPNAAGGEISIKVQQVHDFLQPLSASL